MQHLNNVTEKNALQQHGKQQIVEKCGDIFAVPNYIQSFFGDTTEKS